MRRRKTSETQLTAIVERMAAGGDGIAFVPLQGERRAVFVPQAAVGDELLLAVDASRRPARGRVLEVRKPGEDRVEPACPYVGRCGGCDFMHLSLGGQRRAHADIVRSVLPAAFRSVDLVAHEAHEPLAYRTRARLHVRGTGRAPVVGMHEARSHEPAPVESCVVLSPPLERGRRELGALLEGVRGRGEAQIAQGRSNGREAPVLELRWHDELAPVCFGRLEQAVRDGRWAGARVFSGNVSRPAILGDPTPWMRGADGEPLRLAPGGFAQASESANQAIGRRLAAVFGELAPKDGTPLRVVELYAGAGNFTAVLARLSPQLSAVESSREACDAARANLEARGLRARVVEADAESYAWSPSTNLLVLDPPRSGARAVAQRLAERPVRYVLYVSCDPATLGRDLALLENAYALASVETFEMFPQTSHVETLVRLERRSGTR